jgi:hypothetical protein
MHSEFLVRNLLENCLFSENKNREKMLRSQNLRWIEVAKDDAHWKAVILFKLNLNIIVAIFYLS